MPKCMKTLLKKFLRKPKMVNYFVIDINSKWIPSNNNLEKHKYTDPKFFI